MTLCEMCGGSLPPQRTSPRRFCDACRKQRRHDYNMRRKEANARYWQNYYSRNLEQLREQYRKIMRKRRAKKFD